MHAGDGDDGQDEQRGREETRTEADDERDRADQFEPGRQLPAEVDRHDIEREGELVGDLGKPIFAAELLQTRLEKVPAEQQPQAQEA